MTWRVLLAAIAATIAVAPRAHGGQAASRDSRSVPAEHGAGAPRIIVNPDWERIPSGDDLSKFYPPLAAAISLEGKVRMVCAINATGTLEDCRVTRETPAGIGFGLAALRMASSFRMKPQTVDGTPVGGARVQIPIHFSMDGQASPPPAAPPTQPQPQPSERAMNLARRLTDDLDVPAEIDRNADALLAVAQKAAELKAPPGSPLSATPAALASLREAYGLAKSPLLDRAATVYATTYSEDELRRVIAFMESPSGKVWIARSKDVSKALAAGFSAENENIKAEARRRFCRRVVCLDPDSDTKSPSSPK